MEKITYTEIFYSLQGEGRWAGVPSVFFRTYGCNFRCRKFGRTDDFEGHNPEVVDIIEMVKADPEKYKKFEDLPLVTSGCDTYASIYPEFKKFNRQDDVPDIVDEMHGMIPHGRWDQDCGSDTVHLVITGGEPLMSGETWKLIDWFKDNKGRSKTKLAINSNLGMDSDKLQEFIAKVKDIPHLEIYTSMESVSDQAEYIRDGLDYNQWLHNIQALLEEDSIKAVHCMCTINALCLNSLDTLLDKLVELKKIYGRERVSFTLNILRFPSFQSPLVLPEHLLLYYRNKLILWTTRHQAEAYMHEHEINHLSRLIEYLDRVKTPHSDTFEMPKLHNDFKQFHTQYDQRRSKDFVTTFPVLKTWYDTL